MLNNTVFELILFEEIAILLRYLWLVSCYPQNFLLGCPWYILHPLDLYKNKCKLYNLITVFYMIISYYRSKMSMGNNRSHV